MQAFDVVARISHAEPGERLLLAHGLKGSARSVGAFAIAECAGQIEIRPADAALLARLTRLLDELRDFVAAIGR